MRINKNETTGLSYLGGSIKGDTPMKRKISLAKQAMREANFWNFSDTGEVEVEFEALSIKENEEYTVPTFDSENGSTKTYTLFLCVNDEACTKIVEKMNLSTKKELVLYTTLNKAYPELWQAVKSVKEEAINMCQYAIKYNEDAIKELEEGIEDFRKRITRIETDERR